MSMCPPINEAASELLALIAAVNDSPGDKASKQYLEHLVEDGSEQYDVTVLQHLLGPRPRRRNFLLHLGDLYDYYLIEIDDDYGYVVKNRA